MGGIARVGDIVTGTCPCHEHPISVTGVIVSGAGTVQIEGAGAARVGDVVTFSCGHTGTIVSGSGTVQIEGALAARIGDSVIGCPVGVIVSSAGSVTNDS